MFLSIEEIDDDDDNSELLVLGNVTVDGRTEAALLRDDKIVGEETILNAIGIVFFCSENSTQ